MVSNGLPKVLEFNARLGDPETQPILVRMKGDIVPLFEACIDGELDKYRVDWDNRVSVCVVMASKGYPGKYEKGKTIEGLQIAAQIRDIVVFHAGTTVAGGQLVTDGGRVLGVTGLGENIQKAIEKTYEAVQSITWEGAYYRTDIGQKALKLEKGESATLNAER